MKVNDTEEFFACGNIFATVCQDSKRIPIFVKQKISRGHFLLVNNETKYILFHEMKGNKKKSRDTVLTLILYNSQLLHLSFVF